MNKIILFFTFFHPIIYSFIENRIPQEYHIICRELNKKCIDIHPLIEECGIVLFNLWLKLDLLYSISMDDYSYDKFYKNINKKIDDLYNVLLTLKNNDIDQSHQKDIEKILFYFDIIKQHQIIKYTEEILENILRCHELIKAKK